MILLRPFWTSARHFSVFYNAFTLLNVNNLSDQGTFPLLLIFIFPFVLGWLLLCRPWLIICDIVKLTFLQTKHLHFSSRHKFLIYITCLFCLFMHYLFIRRSCHYKKTFIFITSPFFCLVFRCYFFHESIMDQHLFCRVSDGSSLVWLLSLSLLWGFWVIN